ncbi:S26 family signal peptidase [Hallella bergensis]|uniref:S26 family signal peptidase n=1 Tax=Hallella bergensis TaxID=242750 RepID=UPI0039904021
MKQAIKALSALGVALVIVLAVRAYAFTVYTVPTDISQTLRRGDRVVVNRLSHVELRKGELVVFRRRGDVIGKVEAVPGDTVRIGSRLYLVPWRCCPKCKCNDCRLYLVNLGQGWTLVYQHQMVGRATKLFHLPF